MWCATRGLSEGEAESGTLNNRLSSAAAARARRKRRVSESKQPSITLHSQGPGLVSLCAASGTTTRSRRQTHDAFLLEERGAASRLLNRLLQEESLLICRLQRPLSHLLFDCENRNPPRAQRHAAVWSQTGAPTDAGPTRRGGHHTQDPTTGGATRRRAPPEEGPPGTGPGGAGPGGWGRVSVCKRRGCGVIRP
ncbi:unnamed protein product [Arctogadus glacialis]